MVGEGKKEERDKILREVFPEGPMGSVDLNRDVSRNIEAGASFPFLEKVFAGVFNFSYSKDVDMTLTATKARNRRMNWTNFMEAVRTAKIKQSVVDQVDEGNFVIPSVPT
jgi:hypothetical protein